MATNDKYDRQLRLWGAKGQKALAETHVILIHASAAGTETVKNLVLPGVGCLTVVDLQSQKVTPQDASSNFFLPLSHVHTSRAMTAAQCLGELNPDVQTHYKDLMEKNFPSTVEGWKTVLLEITTAAVEKKDHNSIRPPNVIVVASDLTPDVLTALGEACCCPQQEYPLLAVTSYGLLGCVRLQLPGSGMALLDPKPTHAPPDLRLAATATSAAVAAAASTTTGSSSSSSAFVVMPGLVRMADALDLSKLDSQQHGHVPYPILLLKAVQAYQSQQPSQAEDGAPSRTATAKKSLPKTFAEKQEFVNLLKSMSRDLDKELNFQEAVANAYLAYTEREIVVPDNMEEDGTAGNDNTTTTTTSSSSSSMATLQQLYAALKTFMDRHHGQPPVNGSIPDMTASTEWYVQLQRIYKDQAQADLEEMKQLLKNDDHSLSNNNTIDDETIATFCANVFAVGHLETRSLAVEYKVTAVQPDQELIDDWKMALMDPYEDGPIHTPLVWYLGLRACQVFHQQNGYFPGSHTEKDWKADIAPLAKIYRDTIVPQYQLTDQELLSYPDNVQKICHELTRYGNAEVHTIASVVGGVASQEAVKIITGQYIPVDNTYMYNGMVSVGGVYKM